jgi:hypothetical protein
MASEAENKDFTPDTNIQKMAEAYSLDAIGYAKRKFNLTLDWSDDSIKNVEKALSLMHASYLKSTPRPTQDQVMSFAKGFGSYIGEVYRRNHGAEWGIVNLNGQKFPGLKSNKGVNFWPWSRALNRIMQGGENNISDYYKALLE